MPRQFQRKGKRNKDGISRAVDDAPERPVKRVKPTLPEPQEEATEPVEESEWPILDPDNKAYWIQINQKIIELENVGVGEEDGDEPDERKLLLRTALNNLANHELALATDPEASVILERLLHTMDDFARRVLADRFAGLYVKLAQHQFASHVVEALFTLGAQTADREVKGVIAAAPESQPEAAQLPGMVSLLVSATQELASAVPKLICHTYGSHPLRAALHLLSGKTAAPQSSKKSQKFKRGQAPMKSLFDQDDKGKERSLELPKEFGPALTALFDAVDEALGRDGDGNLARQTAGDDVGTLVVQLVLQIEADLGQSDQPGSLLDRLLQGLITSIHSQESAQLDRSDFLESMLRSPTTSHTFEVILTPAVSSDDTFKAVWDAYFKDRIGKMASHPVSNFVFSRAVQRLDAADMDETLQKFKQDKIGKLLLETNRSGPLQALIDRCATLGQSEGLLVEILQDAFEIQEVTPTALQALLRLSRVSILAKAPNTAFSTQGSFLTQSWLRLQSPHQRLILDSLAQQPIKALLEMAKNSVTCPVLEMLLSTKSVPWKDKRALVMKFLGHYHTLADDRSGSRAADACWAAADVYLKDKIAVSVADHQDFLLGSRFGSFFLKKLFLPLHQRKNEEWKTKMVALAQAESKKQACGMPLRKLALLSFSPDDQMSQTRESSEEEEDVSALLLQFERIQAKQQRARQKRALSSLKSHASDFKQRIATLQAGMRDETSVMSQRHAATLQADATRVQDTQTALFASFMAFNQVLGSIKRHCQQDQKQANVAGFDRQRTSAQFSAQAQKSVAGGLREIAQRVSTEDGLSFSPLSLSQSSG